MGKYILSAAMVLMMSFAFSQAKVELGLKGGLNLANISSDVDATI